MPAALGLCRGMQAALRARHHPQSLCRPHLHRADRSDPPSRRQAQAQRQPHPDQGQARHPRRRFDRARHDLDEDRRHAAPGRRERGAYAHLEPAHDAFLLLRDRDARARQDCWPAHMSIDEMGKFIGAETRWPSSRSTASTAPWARRSAIARTRNFCDACFTGDYPIPLVDHDAGKVSTQLSLLTETCDGPSRRPIGAGHRRLARAWRGGGQALCRRGRACDRVGAPQGGAGRTSTTRSKYRWRRDAGAARPARLRQDRPRWRFRSMSASAGSTCSSAPAYCGASRADRAFRSRTLAGNDRGEPHRQLAADPLARSAAAPVRRRDARSSRPAPPRARPRLLERLRRAKAGLETLVKTYAAEIAHTPMTRQSRRSRPGPHRAAHQRLSGRGQSVAPSAPGRDRPLRRGGGDGLLAKRGDHHRLGTAKRHAMVPQNK